MKLAFGDSVSEGEVVNALINSRQTIHCRKVKTVRSLTGTAYI